MFLFVLRHLGVLAVLVATLYAAGRRAAGRLRFANVAEELGVSLGLGAGIGGSALFFLALSGHLTRAGVLGLVVAVHAAAIPVWIDVARRVSAAGPRRVFRSAPVFVSALALPSLAMALYPPTAFDETLYHLPIARSLAASHSVGFETNLRNPVFPELVECLNAALLLVSDVVSCHLVECVALAAVALALFGFLRRWCTPSAGFLAAAFWVGSPLVVRLAAASLVDIDLALFVVLAYFSWEAGRETGDRRWVVVAAVFAGFAAGTKYLGLAVPLLLAALTLVSGFGWARRARTAILILVVAVAVLAPWYAWIFAETGNPLFPYLARIFGRNEWNLGTKFFARLSDDASAWSSLWRPSQITPAWLAALPLAALAALRAARARRTLLMALAYAIPLMTRDVRFIFPSLALLGAAAAPGADMVFPGSRGARAAAVLAGAFLLVPVGLVATRGLAFRGPVPSTPAESADYLRRRVPGYAAVEWLNAHSGSAYRAYFLHGERLTYYADGDFLGDWRGPARFEKITRVMRDSRKLNGTLRALGCGFFATDLETARRMPADAHFRRHFQRVYSDRSWIVWKRSESPTRAPPGGIR